MEEQQTNLVIEQYEFQLEEKVKLIKDIQDKLVRQLCQCINIDEKTVLLNDPGNNLIVNTDPSLEAREKTSRMSLQEQLEISLEHIMMKEFEKLQDN